MSLEKLVSSGVIRELISSYDMRKYQTRGNSRLLMKNVDFTFTLFQSDAILFSGSSTINDLLDYNFLYFQVKPLNIYIMYFITETITASKMCLINH